MSRRKWAKSTAPSKNSREPIELTIARHGVASSGRNPFASVEAASSLTLTDFQADLIDHPSPVRICSAPTGAGKTFAYEWGPAIGLNTLFVVPTRRLAQNLQANVRATMQKMGWNAERITRHLHLWSSDDTKRRQADGMTSHEVRQERVRRMRGFSGAPFKGQFIIATPESVAGLLLRPPKAEPGMPQFSLSDIAAFDHIVFDEFHTIDDRGLGLAAAIAKVAEGVSPRGGRRPHITFLSATPIDIAGTLVAFGIEEASIATLSEKISTPDVGSTDPKGFRTVHGDVRLTVGAHAGLAEACRAEEVAISETLARGKMVILVGDSIASVKGARPDLATIFLNLGVAREDILTINSIDDAHSGGRDDYGRFGGLEDASTARVILATSSIEMGVTFDSTMMITEPGHDLCSFMQRLGRVARKDVPGRVIVTSGGMNKQAHGAISRGMAAARISSGSRVDIETFTTWILAGRASEMEVCEEDLERDTVPSSTTYRTMGVRAVWCATLFWCALSRNWQIKKGERDLLYTHRPKRGWEIEKHLRALEKSHHRDLRDWAAALVGMASILRSIEPRVRVQHSVRVFDFIPRSMAMRYSDILAAPVLEDQDGPYVALRRPLEQILSNGDKRRYQATIQPLPPLSVMELPEITERDAAAQWVRAVEDASRRIPGADEDLASATRLVRLTGFVPMLDVEVFSSGSGVV